ncbi:hydroxycinnamoyl-CoA:piscidic acid hydroxycinnamoyltransferase-like [Vicia villosa]|uniref:hydroxycinnamoyl-CoA:piscidic acid hydroxycinnamoyltransferase-like n=1 Tax=Vicia villosa TaxID=3911 RepID=UPI00273BC807|nr:hydroxycinnamoyl-CoA:piscidic acid hydroxycinnamoyltransferase-like [Vicia villosa]
MNAHTLKKMNLIETIAAPPSVDNEILTKKAPALAVFELFFRNEHPNVVVSYLKLCKEEGSAYDLMWISKQKLFTTADLIPEIEEQKKKKKRKQEQSERRKEKKEKKEKKEQPLSLPSQLEAQTTKTIHDYGDFSPSDSTKELVPLIDYTQPIEDIPLFLVQLTRFQNNDEGFAIGVAFFHLLSDGLGAIRFINSWAKVARGETLEANELPFLDRTLLKFSHKPVEQYFEHMELKPLPLILGREDTSEERKKKTSATLLRLSPEQVEELKKKANEYHMKKKGSRCFSKYEAIGAHIWRCASKARELGENQQSVVRFHADIRSRMIPPLPKNYFGNALTQTAAKGYVGEITSKPLGDVSQMIREAIEFASDEFIRSQIDIIRGFEHLDDARALFLGGEGDKFPYVGNPNFHLTSWMSMPVYEADFGWGKPAYFGMASVFPHDRAVILLSPDEDGSVLVCLHFQIAHLELFKKFFYEDI